MENCLVFDDLPINDDDRKIMQNSYSAMPKKIPDGKIALFSTKIKLLRYPPIYSQTGPMRDWLCQEQDSRLTTRMSNECNENRDILGIEAKVTHWIIKEMS